MAKKIKKTLLYLFVVGVTVAFAMVFYLYQQIHAPTAHEAPSLYVIEHGTSIKAIAKDLEQKGIISSALIFEINARFIDNDEPFKAGEYRILQYTSIQNLTDTFQSGKTYQHPITIPEGLTKKQIIPILEADDALKGDIVSLPTEGHLLPQTYFFDLGTKRQALIDRMNQAHNRLLDRLWEERAQDLPFDSKEEAIILASIVERETGIKEERERVAGVFINRLKKGMKLQSDPTIIYPLSQEVGVLARPLYRSDWAYNNPYNTYMNYGLPPSAIANPGEASLRAVLNPEKHDFLYFVADGSGGHVFSKTLAEHNENVAKWRAYKKENNLEQ